MRNPIRGLSAFTACSALFLAAGLSLASADDHKAPARADSAAIVPPGKHGHMHCMPDSAEMAKLRQTVQDALKSGDNAKMKSALTLVDAHFTKMQGMMDRCKPGMKKDGAMMDHEDGMMCGKDHKEEGPAKHDHHK